GNNPHVECNFSVFSHAQDAVLLQYAQELCLEGCIQFANLIEEEDTTLSRTYQTFPIAVRAGKSAAPMPKQFALCQARTQRTTVEGYERALTSLRIYAVDATGQEFLPRPRLARD